MGVTHQSRIGRKASGGRYTTRESKRQNRAGRVPINTSIGEKKVKVIRARGGLSKVKVASVTDIAILDKKTNKHVKGKILRVVENPASRHLVRQNTLTKGAVIETDKGRAKITSRPGQDGTVQAVLI